MVLLRPFILLALCWQVFSGENDKVSPQEKLLEKFFGSNRRLGEVVPKKNLSDGVPLKVKFGYVISHIYEIKSSEEEIDLGIWISLQWYSELVRWNASAYPLKYLEVPTDKVWIPRLYLIENAITKPLAPTPDNSNVLIYPTGYTTVDFALTIKLTCSMPACLFPADAHTCKVTFNTISYDRNVILLEYNKKLSDEYSLFEKLETGLWKLTRHPFEEFGFITAAGSGGAVSSALKSRITFTRKSGYYTLTVIGPIILICLVTFCSVLLPWENGERTSLLITCFLALIVYLDTILDNVPKTSDYVPIIVWFVMIVLLFTILQILLTAMTSYYAERASRRKKFKAPHKCLIGIGIAMFRKVFCKSEKKEDEIQSMNVADRQDTTEKDVEIVRKYPPVLSRNTSLTSQGNRRKISNSYIVERNMSGVYEENHENVADTTSKREPIDCGYTEGAEKCDGKECKFACKVIDRISVFISFCFLTFCPIFFHLLYTGKIPLDCKGR